MDGSGAIHIKNRFSFRIPRKAFGKSLVLSLKGGWIRLRFWSFPGYGEPSNWTEFYRIERPVPKKSAWYGDHGGINKLWYRDFYVVGIISGEANYAPYNVVVVHYAVVVATLFLLNYLVWRSRRRG